MKSLRTGAGVMILCMVAGAVPAAVSAAPDDSPGSALVLVISRYFKGQTAGNGFVVGDGTLVVTSDHLVYESSKRGGHRLEGIVTVFSPYLGRAWDARILAADEELDLAVLEVPWRGHPALAVADANAVLEARSARIVGLPAVVKRLEDWAAGEPEDFVTQEEELPVDFIAVRARVPRFIMLRGAGQVGHGWSGSPILLPDGSAALGCFNILHSTSKDERASDPEAAGPVAERAFEILPAGFDRHCLRPVTAHLESPADAHEACALALRAASLLRPDQYAAALESARAFIRLRPASGVGHKLLAYANDKLGQAEAARQSYQRAVELDPNSLNGQLLYAQFLAANGDPNGAREILESCWRAGRSRDLVAIALVNFWSDQKDFSRCLEVLEEATRFHPGNAYLWQQTAGCRMQVQGRAAAVEPLTRAVELYPERGPFRGSLAHLLEATGDLDGAEKHFRQLLEVEPDNPVVYCWLAQFLFKHRPQAIEEALKVAEKALTLPPRASLPRRTIEQLIAEIRARTESSAQN
jgi:Flp pilus assembly protein TadD